MKTLCSVLLVIILTASPLSGDTIMPCPDCYPTCQFNCLHDCYLNKTPNAVCFADCMQPCMDTCKSTCTPVYSTHLYMPVIIR